MTLKGHSHFHIFYHWPVFRSSSVLSAVSHPIVVSAAWKLAINVFPPWQLLPSGAMDGVKFLE